jgi:hypothetical protein
MTLSIEFLAVIIGLALTIATFLYSRFKEAEGRGRLLQRIDNLENTLKELRESTKVTDEAVSCHDNELVKITTDIEGLKKIMERMESKLDKILDAK